MKYAISILLIVLMTAAGCDRYIDSRDPVRSLPTDGPVPANLKVTAIDGGVTLSWEIDDPTGITRYRVYAAEVEAGVQTEYILRDSTTELSITLTNLQINNEYLFQVAAVLTSGLEWERSEAVGSVVTYLSITIEEGAEYTNDSDVRVNINAPVATSHIMLTEDSTFADVLWLPFQGTTRNFIISDGDGVKWVYARLQFTDGSTSGGILSDSIILDTRAQIDSVFFSDFPNGQYFSAGDVITFGLAAREVGGTASAGFTGVGQVLLYDDGSGVDPIAADGVFYGSWTVPGGFTLNNGSVTGTYRDEAGNSAPQITAVRTLNIFTAPPAVTLSASALSTYEISLTWTSAVSNNFASYRIYREAGAVVTETSELITTITSGGTTSYTDTDLEAGFTYYYRVFVYDNIGLSTGSATVSATTEANTPPDPVDLFAVVGVDTMTVTLSWTESDERDFDSYRVYRYNTPAVDTTHSLVILQRNRGTLTGAAGLPTVPSGSNGHYYFRLYVVDRHGAVASSNVVDVHAPEQ